MTETGKTCQLWSADEPHDHDFSQEENPESGLGDHNFCRNPNGESGPWCFTTDPDSRCELCDVGSPRKGCGRKYGFCLLDIVGNFLYTLLPLNTA